MFFSENNDVEQEEFKLCSFIDELLNLVEKYGKMNNLKIEVLDTLDICDISFKLDYQ